MKKILLTLILGLSFNLHFSMMDAAYADHHEKDSSTAQEQKSCDGKSCTDQKACACKMAKKGKPWHHKMMDHTHFYLAHSKDIGLSEDQINQLKDLQSKFEEKNQALQQEWMDKHAAFSEKIHDQKTNEKSIKQHAKEMGDLKAQMIEHHLLHQYASAKVLNEEQNKKVWTLLKEKKDQHKKHKKKKQKASKK